MNLLRVYLIHFTIFIVVFATFSPGFSQVRIGETISLSGVVESVQKDFRFLVMNEVRIFISRDTKVVDESGNTLKISVLKSRLNVTIEAVRNPNGFFAKKIVLKSLKK